MCSGCIVAFGPSWLSLGYYASSPCWFLLLLAFVRSPSTGRIFDPNRAQGASPAGARQLEGGSGGKPTWQGGLPGGRVILAALSLGPEIPHRHAQGLGQLPGGARLSPRARKQPLVTARGLARPSGERRPVIRRVGVCLTTELNEARSSCAAPAGGPLRDHRTPWAGRGSGAGLARTDGPLFERPRRADLRPKPFRGFPPRHRRRAG